MRRGFFSSRCLLRLGLRRWLGFTGLIRFGLRGGFCLGLNFGLRFGLRLRLRLGCGSFFGRNLLGLRL